MSGMKGFSEYYYSTIKSSKSTNAAKNRTIDYIYAASACRCDGHAVLLGQFHRSPGCCRRRPAGGDYVSQMYDSDHHTVPLLQKEPMRSMADNSQMLEILGITGFVDNSLRQRRYVRRPTIHHRD